MPLVSGVTANATLSPCGTYRYLLTREWFPKDRGRVAFVMLNPSIADADQDDRTLRKCQKYARSWGFDGVRVVNLFALRATKPDDLYRHPDPIGEANDDIIDTIATSPTTGLVVVAWGQHGAHRSRGLIVLLRRRGGSIGCSPSELRSTRSSGSASVTARPRSSRRWLLITPRWPRRTTRSGLVMSASPRRCNTAVPSASSSSMPSRSAAFCDRLLSLGVKPMRLGPPTKGGHPWHPLYRPDDIELEEAA